MKKEMTNSPGRQLPQGAHNSRGGPNSSGLDCAGEQAGLGGQRVSLCVGASPETDAESSLADAADADT